MTTHTIKHLLETITHTLGGKIVVVVVVWVVAAVIYYMVVVVVVYYGGVSSGVCQTLCTQLRNSTHNMHKEHMV